MLDVDTTRITRTTFELRPRDGSPPIRGDLRVPQGPQRRSAVILCHGFKGFRAWGSHPHLARAIAARGHAAISVDFSHNGLGADGVDFSALELFAEQTHTRNVEEIRMVVEAVSGGELVAGIRKIGVWGHSRGGGEAVLAAAQEPRIGALVTWSAIASVHRWTEEQMRAWRRGDTVTIPNARTGQQMPIAPAYWRDVEEHIEQLDIRAAAGRVSAPWLIVHGDADEAVLPQEGTDLFDMAGENAELLVVEGADHTFGARHPYKAATPELRTAADATLDWFDQHLG
jgi:uncharacterized protein